MLRTEPVDCVDMGVDLLDREVPDWYHRINVVTLNIGDPDNCICAQLFGDFVVGMEKLCVSDYPLPYGFVAMGDDYPVLTQLWCERIIERREAAAISAELGNLNIGDLPNDEGEQPEPICERTKELVAV